MSKNNKIKGKNINMKWLKSRLDSKNIESIDEIDLFDSKNILIAPEGYGKSTQVLKKIIESEVKTVIYGTHTISNAEEKFNYIKKYHPSKKAFLIESDSELFRKMLLAQDEKFYNITKKISSKVDDEYLVLSLYSFNKSLKKIAFNEKSKYKLEASLEQNEHPCNYNSTLVGDLYSYLNSIKCKNTKYYLLYKMVYKTEDCLDNIDDDINLEEMLQTYNGNIESIKTLLKDCGIGIICITSKSISNWKGFRKQRDKDLKEALSTKNSLIITQNRVVENTLIPKIKNEKDILFVMDEITLDCFNICDGEKLTEFGKIVRKIQKYGEESLTISDKYLLSNFNLDDKNVKLDSNINVGNLCVRITKSDIIKMIGKPFLSHRLNFFSNILILTSELLLPSILTKSFDFKCYEIDSNFSYVDKKIKIFKCGKNEKINLVKKNKSTVSDFVSTYKTLGMSKSDTMTLGTSYFNVDNTLESCKGRNFNPRSKLGIFKNPDNRRKFEIFYNFISYYENSGEELDSSTKENIRVSYNLDLINQIFGRFSGYRRINNKNNNTKIDVFYSEMDRDFEKALTYSRYKSFFKTFNSEQIVNKIENKSNAISKKFKEFEKLYNLITDYDEINKTENPKYNVYYNLDYLQQKYGYTKRYIMTVLHKKIIQNFVYNLNDNFYRSKKLTTLFFESNDVCDVNYRKCEEILNKLKSLFNLDNRKSYCMYENNLRIESNRKRTYEFIELMINSVVKKDISGILNYGNNQSPFLHLMLRKMFWDEVFKNENDFVKIQCKNKDYTLTEIHSMKNIETDTLIKRSMYRNPDHFEYYMNISINTLYDVKEQIKEKLVENILRTDSFNIIDNLCCLFINQDERLSETKKKMYINMIKNDSANIETQYYVDDLVNKMFSKFDYNVISINKVNRFEHMYHIRVSIKRPKKMKSIVDPFLRDYFHLTTPEPNNFDSITMIYDYLTKNLSNNKHIKRDTFISNIVKKSSDSISDKIKHITSDIERIGSQCKNTRELVSKKLSEKFDKYVLELLQYSNELSNKTINSTNLNLLNNYLELKVKRKAPGYG